MAGREGSRSTRNASQLYQETISLQIMHINQRIKIRTPISESLDSFFQKLILFFEIEKNSNKLGLLERKDKDNYVYVSEKSELENDKLYYLYFRDKALERSVSPPQLAEESKKSGSLYSGSPTPGSGTFKRYCNSSYSNFKGVSLSQAQIEKVKRPKDEKKILLCPFEKCMKEFSETGNLKTHMRTHTGERPFICSQCHQQFITKGHLQAHELTHTGEKPFLCSHSGCNKRYSRAGRLKIHQRLHTGERPFICQVEGCEKSFREKGNLLTHMRIHNGQKPFKCDFADCDMSFTTQGHLTDHKRRHSGERPYICKECGDKFMRSSTLKIHLRRHTGERPYKCDKCEKGFSESGNLKTHLKTHEEERLEIRSIGKRSKKSLSSRSASPSPRQVNLCQGNKRVIKMTEKSKFKAPLLSSKDEIIISPEIKSNKKSQQMPIVEMDFQKANKNQNQDQQSHHFRKHSNQMQQLSKQTNQQMHQNIKKQSQQPHQQISHSASNSALFGNQKAQEDDIKIPLNLNEQNPNMNEYNNYFQANPEQMISGQQQYFGQLGGQINYSNNMFNDFNPNNIQHSQYQNSTLQQQFSQNYLPFSPSSMLQPSAPSFCSPKFTQFFQVNNTPSGRGGQRTKQLSGLRTLHQQPQMIQQVGAKFSPMNRNSNLNLLESPDQFMKMDQNQQNMHQQQQQSMRFAPIITTNLSGLGGMIGNGTEMSPLYKKSDVKLIIGGNISSPGLNINKQVGNPNNWSAAPSAGPSPVDDNKEAQSFTSLTKMWKQDNSPHSPLGDDQNVIKSPNKIQPPFQDNYQNFTSLVNANRGQNFGVGQNPSAFKSNPQIKNEIADFNSQNRKSSYTSIPASSPFHQSMSLQQYQQQQQFNQNKINIQQVQDYQGQITPAQNLLETGGSSVSRFTRNDSRQFSFNCSNGTRIQNKRSKDNIVRQDSSYK